MDKEIDYVQIKKEYLEGTSLKALAKKHNVPYSTLSKKASSEKWKADKQDDEEDEAEPENNKDDLDNLKNQNNKQKVKSKNFEPGKQKKSKTQESEEGGNFFNKIWDFFIGF